MAGLGAAINTGEVTRGKSVAVIGCGGVGVAAIAGSALAGASTIIAVDIDDQEARGGDARWAPRTRSTRRRPTRSTAIQELTGGFGADVVIDAVGRPETWKQAFYARDLAGTVVLVGVPTPDMKIPDIPLIDVFGRGGALKSSWYGDCLPTRDFPMLVDLYLQGRLDLDAFVTEEIGLGDVEAAFEQMHDGDVLRSVVDPLMTAPRSTTASPAAPSASTARPSTSTTTSGWSATTPSASSSTRRTTSTASSPSSGTAGSRRSCARMPTTTTCGSRRRCASAWSRRSCCTPTTGRCGS